MRFRLLFVAFWLLIFFVLQPSARAQTTPPPTFYTTYTYAAYTVFEADSEDPPTEVAGVGGTLTLRSNGQYAKRLEITNNSGLSHFNQDGRYTLAGDSIRFAYTDAKGRAQTYEGIFLFQPQTNTLDMTIFGFPAGSKGVYKLKVGGKAPAAPPAKQPAHKPAQQPRK